VAGAEMEINHFTLCDGATPMERAGIVAMSSSALVAPNEWQAAVATMSIEEVLDRVKDVDEVAVAVAVRDRCETLQGMHRINQDKRSRANFARRVAVNERKNGFGFMHENEGMAAGDVVDWGGSMWTYLEHEGAMGRPTKLLLEKLKPPGQGVRKWAMLEEVRPVAIGREELELPRDPANDCGVLDTVAYDWEDEVHLGVVLRMDVVEGTVRVHVLQQRECKTGVTYVLNWTGGPGGKPDRRCEVCPEGYAAEVRVLERGAVLGRVCLMGNNKLNEESARYLESLGVETGRNGR
jgi:hypothetical protein